MTLWIFSLILLILALAFIIYPFIDKKNTAADHGHLLAANVAVFRDTEMLLNNQLKAGDIDQAQYEELLAEAQQLLLANTEQIEGYKTTQQPMKKGVWLLPVLLLSVPLVTFVAYSKLGAAADQQIADLLKLQFTKASELNRTPQPNNGTAAENADDAEAAQQFYRELHQQLAEQVTARVKERPENTYYWVILAQQATARGDIQAANNYYFRALEFMPNDGYLLAQYAETQFILANSQFTQSVIQALDKAFAVDSSNSTVLGLKGIQAFEDKQWQLAITYWQGALQQVERGSSTASTLETGIRHAKDNLQASQLQSQLRTEKTVNSENSTTSAISQSLQLLVSIDPSINFDPQQTVFVALVANAGPPMPLAARKLQARDLPIQISLSDADAVMVGHNLSGAKEFKAIARLSQTGSATPQSGDWEVSTGAIQLGFHPENIELRIATQRP